MTRAHLGLGAGRRGGDGLEGGEVMAMQIKVLGLETSFEPMIRFWVLSGSEAAPKRLRQPPD